LFFSRLTPTTYFYTLSLHDALPIFSVFASKSRNCYHSPSAREALRPALLRPVTDDTETEGSHRIHAERRGARGRLRAAQDAPGRDRKSTRLNSSHSQISYAVFCLKK